MSIYSKLSSLLTAANNKTGESDTTLTDAVQTLIDGYGQGGGSNEDALLNGSLTTYENSNITTLRQFAFANYTNLVSVSFPALTSFGQRAFAQCGNLESVSFPSLTATANYTFPECQKLITIPKESFPSLITLADFTFQNCQHLEFADFPVLTEIKGNAFSRCFLLETLVLRSTTLCSLVNITAFDTTPFRGRDSKVGKLYVPASLVDTYKAASNWSTLYSGGTMTVHAIEGSAYE